MISRKHHPNNSTLLHETACKGYKEMCELLISAGLSVESVDGNNQTPLFLAAQYGQTSICL